MRLKNKKTGEIMDYNPTLERWNGPSKEIKHYVSLAELNAEWEDYEEPKEYWFLSGRGEVKCIEDENTVFDKDHKTIGNYFSSREEAELVVRKLKAWKRLKDSKIKFCLDFVMNKIVFTYVIGKNTIVDAVDAERQIFEDMKIVFGGEE